MRARVGVRVQGEQVGHRGAGGEVRVRVRGRLGVGLGLVVGTHRGAGGEDGESHDDVGYEADVTEDLRPAHLRGVRVRVRARVRGKKVTVRVRARVRVGVGVRVGVRC